MIRVEPSDPRSSESQQLIAQLTAELARITGEGGTASFSLEDIESERAMWVLARNQQGESIGCGAIRPLSADTAELKRMYSTGREQGTGRALLLALEAAAIGLDYRYILLETRKVNQRAVAFYLKQGYQVTENYGRYVGRDEAICFRKALS
ncbi:GNAT family N-acetyltransferase [Pseudescherichia vulneris]